MSPTYYEVQMARLDKDSEAARLAGDLPRLRELLGKMASLLQAMYGRAVA